MLRLTYTCKRLFVLASAWLCIVVCSISLAQPPQGPPPGPPPQGPPRGSKESREFWSILGEAFKESDNTRRFVWLLIENPSVRAEIKLTDTDFHSFDELNGQQMSEIRKLRDEFVKAPDKQVCHKGLVERLNQHNAAFTQKLGEVADFQRLMEISAQIFGNRAVTIGEIATKVGLSNEKLIEIRHLTEKVRRDEFEKMGDKMGELMRSGPQNDKKIRDIFKQLDEKVDEAIKAKLTTEQLDALQQMKGEPFEVPKDLYERRSRPGRMPGGDNRNNKDKKDNCAHCCNPWFQQHS